MYLFYIPRNKHLCFTKGIGMLKFQGGLKASLTLCLTVSLTPRVKLFLKSSIKSSTATVSGSSSVLILLLEAFPVIFTLHFDVEAITCSVSFRFRYYYLLHISGRLFSRVWRGFIPRVRLVCSYVV